MDPEPWADLAVLGAFLAGTILGVIATIRIARLVIDFLHKQDERSKPPE